MEVIINADDFGWSQSCSDAILETFRKGWITTTTAVAGGEAFDYAVERIFKTEYPDRVGIHFDLTEGTPLTDGMKKDDFFCNGDGVYHMHPQRYQRLDAVRRKTVYDELTAQVKRIRETGLAIHHADSHHHIHTAPFITPIVLQVMKENGIHRLRIQRNIGNIPGYKRLLKRLMNTGLRPYAYSDLFGSFDDAKWAEKYADSKKKLEIMCHPDYTRDGVLIDRGGDCTYDDPAGTPMEELLQLLDRKREI